MLRLAPRKASLHRLPAHRDGRHLLCIPLLLRALEVLGASNVRRIGDFVIIPRCSGGKKREA